MDNIGSAGVSEADLAAAMEACSWPNADFHHPDHLRLAWHYLRALGTAAAEDRMRQTIRRYAASLGHPEKYHDTVTIAWMRLVDAAIACTPHHREFAVFAAAHPWLLDRDALLAFYSRELLFGAAARSAWIEPDLRPLPQRA